ncbi:MAG TPA: hemolysin family protein [Phycisphaerae bacterium]|nr:hemolysin family protein [Phycisphaerae bacterium]
MGVILDNLTRLIAIVLLMAASGMISAGETALFALSRQQLARLKQSGHLSAQIILRLRKDPQGLLSTILLSNITINVLLYSLMTVTAKRLSGGSPLVATLLGTGSFLFMLLGIEIFPKLIAYSISDRLAPIVAGPIQILSTVTYPVRRLLEAGIVGPLTRILGGTMHQDASIKAEELQQLVNVCRSEGLIGQGENTLLHQVMELSQTRVRALMVPRVDVVAFNLNDNPARLVELIKRHRLLRIPVYEDNIDDVKGIVLSKEFLLDPQKSPKSLVKPIAFVPEQASVEALLRHFRKTGTQLALVVDEYGGLAGIVALEDVVEAIVGEMHAPGEVVAVKTLERIDATTFIVDAGLDLDDFRRAFQLPIEESRVQTVGGLVWAILERIPTEGDEVRIDPATLVVVSMRRRRIMTVKLILERPPKENPDLARLTGEGLPVRPKASSSRGKGGA